MPLTFESALSLQEIYRPTDEEVLRRLGTISLVTFCGPTGAGKNHTIELAGYPLAGTVTTREPRSSDQGYIYLSMDEMLARIEKGEVVQYGANEHIRVIYGSVIENYHEGSLNAMDVLTSIAGSLRSLGYQAVHNVGIVAPPREWEERLDVRFANISPAEISGRLQEAETALRIFIDSSWHTDPDRLLIVSTADLDNQNKLSIADFVTNGTAEPQPLAFEVATDMLAALPALRNKYLEWNS